MIQRPGVQVHSADDWFNPLNRVIAVPHLCAVDISNHIVGQDVVVMDDAVENAAFAVFPDFVNDSPKLLYRFY